mgnify:CR=1 FL=1
MTLLSVGITTTTMFTLRAFAQQPAVTPAPDEAGATGDALPDEESRRPAPAPILPPDPPELRESADNNISFPVDI